MGIGNLTSVVRAYTGQQDEAIDTVVRDDGIDTRSYFDSSPIGHRAAWERLASFGDDSQTYYWRVLAALGVMASEATQPGSSCSPIFTTSCRAPGSSFIRPQRAGASRTEDSSKPLSRVASSSPFRWWRHSFRDRSAARENRGLLSENPSTYVALRPRAARLSRTAQKVYELSGEERPLAVTRATYDEEVAVTLTSRDPGAAADAACTPQASALTFAGDTDQENKRRHSSGRSNVSRRWA